MKYLLISFISLVMLCAVAGCLDNNGGAYRPSHHPRHVVVHRPPTVYRPPVHRPPMHRHPVHRPPVHRPMPRHR